MGEKVKLGLIWGKYNGGWNAGGNDGMAGMVEWGDHANYLELLKKDRKKPLLRV